MALNKCIYEGIFSSDVKLGETNSGMKVLNFSVAVKKRKVDKNGNKYDFLPCVAYSNTAELIAKYVEKSMHICVVGRNTMTTYIDKDTGKKVYKTVMMVEEVDFVEFKGDKENVEDESDVNEPIEESALEINQEDLPF